MKRPDAFLIQPDADLKTELLEMAKEYLEAEDTRYQAAIEDFDAYIERLQNAARGMGLAPDRLPETIFWLANSDRRIFGQSRFRHYLNRELEVEGGHVGYDIRPSERNKGFGTLILELTLAKAKNSGLSRVLLTCDADNVASAKVIEKNGGKLQEQAVSQRSGKLISRYWIEL